MKPRRYQLRKEAVAIVEGGHPWIFRDQLSSAATVFDNGDWLALVDGANRVVAHGIFEATGAIAIRILRRGPARPDAAWLRGAVAAAALRRAPLASRTDGIRLIHGESDGIPALAINRFGDTLVAASYSAGADALARLAIAHLPGRAATLRDGHRRGDRAHVRKLRPEFGHSAPGDGLTSDPLRPDTGHNVRNVRLTLRGEPPDVARFTEDGLAFAVDLAGGQKTGAYLDLRGLRHAIATAPLAGARVLNLFAYTGMLGRAAEAAGAAAIVQVDSSERALAFAREHHVADAERHEFVVADLFAWQPPPLEPFDLVIVDPPAMTSNKAQVPTVLAAYRKLYRMAARLVRPSGAVVAACCTSRIERPLFHRTVREALGGGFAMERELPPEIDHPVGFPQADYLKIAWWRRGG